MRGEQPLTISHPGFYYWNRAYASFLRVIGFVFLFFLVRLKSGILPGLIAVLILAGLSTYYRFQRIYRTANAINIARDTRTKAIQYIQNLTDSQSVFLGVEKGLKVSLYDLRESKIAFGYFNIENLEITPIINQQQNVNHSLPNQ